MSATTLPLHWRVTLAYTALGALLSLLFAGAAVFITEDYEHVLANEILGGLAEDYDSRLLRDPGIELPRSTRLAAHLAGRSGSTDVPAHLAALPPGIHEAGNGTARGVHIGVFDLAAGRLFIRIDLGHIKKLEQHLAWFLISVIALGTALAAWLGWILAHRTIAPVRRLARAVGALGVQPEPTRLAAGMAQDDLGRLAQAIDGYQSRLVEASVRERAFFADASHELRTPIAVVRGTAELLLDDLQQDSRLQPQLHRLDRGMQRVTDLLDVLLGLARRRPLELAPHDPLALLDESAGGLTPAECGPALQVRVGSVAGVDAGLPVIVARHEAILLLRCLLRDLLPAEAAGELSLLRRADGFELLFQAAGGELPTDWGLACQRSDAGATMTLVGRLADHLGWAITQTAAGASRSVRIALPPTQ